MTMEMPRRLIAGTSIFVAVGIVAAGYWWYRYYGRLTWEGVNAMIARNFPRVPQMEIRQLAAWLADSKRKPPLLLDVRSRVEYDVSHLHHARWINTAEPVSRAMADVPRTEPIVVYCSVGYRSSAYAQRLIRHGFTNVHDLKGSIFLWADEGRPVYRSGRIVHHVHPYNRYWGQLLKRSLWEFHVPSQPTAR